MFEQLLGRAKPPKKLESRVTLVGDRLPGNSGSAAVGGNNSIYLAGGRTSDGTYLKSFRRFDLTTREWVELADLPVALTGATLTYWNGYLYLFGGRSAANYLVTMHIYNIANNTWFTGKPNTGVGRTYHTAVVHNGDIYTFGGWNGTQLRNAEIYNITTDEWRTMTQLPESRHGHMTAIVGTQIFVFGGLTNGGSKTNNDIIRWSIGDNAWVGFIQPNPAPTVRCYSCLLPSYGKLYVFGGYTDGGGSASTDDFWEYTPNLQTWKKITLTGDTLTGRGGFAAAIENGEFHIINGYGKASAPQIVRTDHLYID